MDKILFWGETIEYSQGISNYFSVKKEIEEKEEEIIQEYYSSNCNELAECTTIESKMNLLTEIGNDSCKKMKDLCFSLLVRFKVYTMLKKEYFDYLSRYEPEEPWKHVVDSLHTNNARIDSRQYDKRMAREYRKNNRGRFVGGGFGLKGSLIGAAQAGVLNAVTGLSHTAVNAAANLGTSINAGIEKQKLLKQDRYVRQFFSGLRDSFDIIFEATIDCLLELVDVDILCRVDTKNHNESEAIIQNINEGYIPKEEMKKMIVEAIRRDPLNLDIYSCILNYFPEEKESLKQLTIDLGLDYFEVVENYLDEKLTDIKCDLYEVMYEDPQILTKKEYVSIINMLRRDKSKLKQICDDFNIDESSLENINFEEADDKFKRIYYVELDEESKIITGEKNRAAQSYEEVINALDKREEIEKIWGSVDFYDVSSFRNALKRIIEVDSTTQLAGDLIKELEDRNQSLEAFVTTFGNEKVPSFDDAILIREKINFDELSNSKQCEEAMNRLEQIEVSIESKEVVKKELTRILQKFVEEENTIHYYDNEDMKKWIQKKSEGDSMSAQFIKIFNERISKLLENNKCYFGNSFYVANKTPETMVEEYLRYFNKDKEFPLFYLWEDEHQTKDGYFHGWLITDHTIYFKGKESFDVQLENIKYIYVDKKWGSLYYFIETKDGTVLPSYVTNNEHVYELRDFIMDVLENTYLKNEVSNYKEQRNDVSGSVPSTSQNSQEIDNAVDIENCSNINNQSDSKKKSSFLSMFLQWGITALFASSALEIISDSFGRGIWAILATILICPLTKKILPSSISWLRIIVAFVLLFIAL